MRRINEMKLKMEFLKENLVKNLESKKHKGLSAVEIVIGISISLGLAYIVYLYFTGSLTGTILPSMGQKILDLFK